MSNSTIAVSRFFSISCLVALLRCLGALSGASSRKGFCGGHDVLAALRLPVVFSTSLFVFFRPVFALRGSSLGRLAAARGGPAPGAGAVAAVGFGARRWSWVWRREGSASCSKAAITRWKAAAVPPLSPPRLSACKRRGSLQGWRSRPRPKSDRSSGCAVLFAASSERMRTL